MPFLPPNQQHQSTEGSEGLTNNNINMKRLTTLCATTVTHAICLHELTNLQTFSSVCQQLQKSLHWLRLQTNVNYQ